MNQKLNKILFYVFAVQIKLLLLQVVNYFCLLNEPLAGELTSGVANVHAFESQTRTFLLWWERESAAPVRFTLGNIHWTLTEPPRSGQRLHWRHDGNVQSATGRDGFCSRFWSKMCRMTREKKPETSWGSCWSWPVRENEFCTNMRWNEAQRGRGCYSWKNIKIQITETQKPSCLEKKCPVVWRTYNHL